MNRRSFMAALAGLPFVGRLFREDRPLSYAEKGYPQIYSQGGYRYEPKTKLPEVKWRRQLATPSESLIQLDCGACGTRFVRKVPTDHVSRIVAGSPRCRACHARDERQALYTRHGFRRAEPWQA